MKEMVWGSIISLVVCALIVCYAAFGIPYIEYRKAVTMQENGEVIAAYNAFAAMGDYLDAPERMDALYEQYKLEKFKTAKVGSVIYFGTFEQDNDTSNGEEDIQWKVLEIVDGKALIVSRRGLTCMQYHERNEDVTWEDCTLRAWLNDKFWDEAFSAEEKVRIQTTTVSVDKNSVNTSDQGDPTEDKVFILSRTELETYLKEPDLRRSYATKRAVEEGAYTSDTNGNGWYWTRSPSRYSNEVITVDSFGNIEMHGDGVAEKYYTVRPAMWITLGDI